MQVLFGRTGEFAKVELHIHIYQFTSISQEAIISKVSCKVTALRRELIFLTITASNNQMIGTKIKCIQCQSQRKRNFNKEK